MKNLHLFMGSVWAEWLFAVIWSGLLILAIPVQIDPASEWKIAGYAIFFIASTTVLIGIVRWYTRDRQRPYGRPASPPQWKLFVFGFAACGVVWACYGYMFYPGLISVDFLTQWYEMEGHVPYADWHPVFYGLLVWVVTRLWHTSMAVVLVQGLGFALLVGAAAVKLDRVGVRRPVIVSMILFYALFPMFGIYTVSLIKDIAYAVCLFWLTVTVLEIVITGGTALERARCWVSLILAVLGVALVRHNGIIPAAGTLLVLMGVYREQFKRLVCIAGVVGLLIVFYKGPVFDWLNVEPQGKNVLKAHLPVQHIGAILSDQGELTREEEDFLSQILPLAHWQKAFDPRSCMPLIFGRDEKGRRRLNSDFLNNPSNYKVFIRLWAHLVIKHPMPVLRYHLVASEMAWRITSDYHLWILSEDIVERDLYHGRTRKPPPFEDRVSPLAFNLARLIKNPSTGWLFHRGALLFLLSLFSISLYLLGTGDPRILVVATPVLLQAGTVFAFPVVQNIRFMYPIMITAPLLAALCLSRVYLTGTTHDL